MTANSFQKQAVWTCVSWSGSGSGSGTCVGRTGTWIWSGICGVCSGNCPDWSGKCHVGYRVCVGHGCGRRRKKRHLELAAS